VCSVETSLLADVDLVFRREQVQPARADRLQARDARVSPGFTVEHHGAVVAHGDDGDFGVDLELGATAVLLAHVTLLCV